MTLRGARTDGARRWAELECFERASDAAGPRLFVTLTHASASLARLLAACAAGRPAPSLQRELGVSVAPIYREPYHRTTILTVAPRYLVANLTALPLLLRSTLPPPLPASASQASP